MYPICVIVLWLYAFLGGAVLLGIAFSCVVDLVTFLARKLRALI